jgi:hypothetical protein
MWNSNLTGYNFLLLLPSFYSGTKTGRESSFTASTENTKISAVSLSLLASYLEGRSREAPAQLQ